MGGACIVQGRGGGKRERLAAGVGQEWSGAQREPRCMGHVGGAAAAAGGVSTDLHTTAPVHSQAQACGRHRAAWHVREQVGTVGVQSGGACTGQAIRAQGGPAVSAQAAAEQRASSGEGEAYGWIHGNSR